MAAVADAKYRRCFHRVISGLERGGTIRFITLTSAAPCEPAVMHRHFRALVARLQRRGLLQGYIQVTEYTKSGLVHKHVLFRGSYVEQRLLSAWWNEIHGARIVDIRRVRPRRGDSGELSKRRTAAYMAKYMSKGSVNPQRALPGMHRAHYSWSGGWVWRGFCNSWAALKRVWSRMNHGAVNPSSWGGLLDAWRVFLKHGKGALDAWLAEWEPLALGELFDEPVRRRVGHGGSVGFSARFATD